MSLLINESYANPAKSLWASVNGGAISGNLSVSGSINATGNITSSNTITAGGLMITSSPDSYVSVDGNTGLPASSFGSTGANTAVVRGNVINFAQLGTDAANTNLLVSTAGANNDTLTVGGKVSMLSMGAGAGMAGTATILLGTTNVIIPSSKVTASSLIFLSHAGAGALGPGAGPAQGNLTYRAADIVPGVSFRVNLTDSTGVIIAASLVDVPLVWMVVN